MRASDGTVTHLGRGERARTREERVVKQGVQRRPQLRLGLQYVPDEVLRVLAHHDVVRERVRVGEDAFVRRFHVFGLERGLAHEQGVEDDAGGPHVDLEAVAALAFEDLRRWEGHGGAGREKVTVSDAFFGNGNHFHHWTGDRTYVVGRAAHGLLALAGVGQPRGEAEVAHLDAHLRVDEEVAELRVGGGEAEVVSDACLPACLPAVQRARR